MSDEAKTKEQLLAEVKKLHSEINRYKASELEHKYTEEVLWMTNRQLRDLLDYSPNVIFLKDPEGRFLFINQYGEKYLNVRNQDIVGKTVHDIFPKKDADRYVKEDQQVLETREPLTIEDVMMKNHATRTYVLTKFPLFDENDEPYAVGSIATDITEHRRAEEVLAEERNLLRTLIDNLPDYIYVKDMESRFLLANKASMHGLGVTKLEELVGKMDFDFFPTELSEQYYADERALIESGQPLINREEQNIDLMTGVTDWVLTTKVPFRDSQGNIVGIVGIGRNITERKRAEEVLREKEQWFATTLKSIGDAVITTDNAGAVTFMNPVAEALTGWKHEEVLGKEIVFKTINNKESLPPEIPVKESPEDKILILVNDDSLLIAGDGTEISIEYSGAPIKDDQGNITGAVLVLHDITERKRVEEELRRHREHLEELVKERTKELTIANEQLHQEIIERKQAEQELRESEEKFRQLAENIDQAFWLVGPSEVQKIYMSPAYEKIWGRSCQSWYEQPGSWLDAIHPEDREGVAALIEQSPQEKHEMEYRVVWPDGTIRWVRTRDFPILNEHGEIDRIAGFSADITDHKQAEEALRKSEKKLRELNTSKDTFFSIIAHDLRGPLSSLHELTQFIEENLDRYSPEELKEMLLLQKISSENLYKLLENLLTWSRVQRGMMPYQPQQIDIRWLVDRNIQLLALHAEKKQITLTNLIKEKMDVSIDFNMIDTVIRNLISNALKFTSTEGTVEISAQQDEHKVEVSVSDTGIGIETEDISRLFRIDTKYKRLGTAQEEGTGLGLILCKEFVEHHGGKIWVESLVGKGTTFRFTLPRGLKENEEEHEQ